MKEYMDQQGSKVKVGVAYLFVFSMPGPDSTSLVVDQLNDDGTVGGYDPSFKCRVENIDPDRLWRPIKYGWDGRGDHQAIIEYAGDQALDIKP